MNCNDIFPPGLKSDLENSRHRLLLVDDQPANIKLLHEIFSDDYEIFVATSGKEAIEMVHKCLPDLILLDVIMPELGGLGVCRQLKLSSETRDIPIIFISAQDTPEEETRGLEAGAVDFITKPVNPAVVRARVKTHLTLKRQSDLLRSMVFIDGLTGIANRRRFDEELISEWNRCHRNNVPLGIFMVDIDHFKKYNDLYGHQAGDICLQKVAATLSKTVGRSYDLVARYGGEEFVCLLPGLGMPKAITRAERIVKAISDLALPHDGSKTAPVVTISLGAAVAIPGGSLQPDDLVAAADAELYKVKTSGRNRASGLELKGHR